MHLVHHNFKAACLSLFYLSLCRMAPCKFVLLRSYGVFAHDVLISYPLQITGSLFFTLAAFIIQRSLSSSIAIPRFFESRTCRSGRITVCVLAERSRIFLYTDHCFRESVVRQWSFDPFVVIFLPQVALFLVIFSHLPAEIPGIFLDSLSSRLSIKAILAFGSSPDLVGRNR